MNRVGIVVLSVVFLVAGCENLLIPTSSANTYRVTYNGNGALNGAVPTDPKTYKSGASATVLGNTGSMLKAGFVFDGWNTRSDGTGTKATPGGSLKVTKDLTLFAVWAVGTYGITYQATTATGGTVPVDGKTYTAGETVTVLGNPGALSRVGYLFSGWNTKADGTGTSYLAEATFVMGTENLTLHAVWSLDFSGKWKGIITNTTYTAVNFTVSGTKITGSTTIAYPFSNVLITCYFSSDITINPDNTFSYSSGSVTSGGLKTFKGTFTGTTPENRRCTGVSSYEENSWYQRASMTYEWAATVATTVP